jgi:hypothetical protein
MGYIFEACVRAINGRMRISLKLARQMTHAGAFPLGAQRVAFGPKQAVRASKLFWLIFMLGSVATGLIAGWLLWW